MDFSPTELSEMVSSLADEVLSGTLTEANLRDAEESESGIHRAAWNALAEAGLAGLSLPESVGGGGGGLLETISLLRMVSRHCAPVPALATTAVVGPTLAAVDLETHRKLLSGVVLGKVVLGIGFTEAASREPRAPNAQATPRGDAWVVDGSKSCVIDATIAHHLLTTARRPDGSVGVFLVERSTPAVQTKAQIMSTGQTVGWVSMTQAPALFIGGHEILDRLLSRFQVCIAACLLGAAERALSQTTAYVSEREQFGRQIGTFQAVAHRAADAWLDIQSMEVTLLQAAWRLEAGETAEREVAIARYWANLGAHRIVAAAQHLHGGMGYDRDYPLYRTFLLVKSLEGLLGGTSYHLEDLGRILAEEFAAAPRAS